MTTEYNHVLNLHENLCDLFGYARGKADRAIFKDIQTLLGQHSKIVGDAADLRTQRDALYERLTQVVDVTGEPTLEELVERVIGELTQTREDATDFNQELLDLFTDEVCDSLGLENGFTPEQFHAALGVPRPHDKRYIVHGDIQPCVVLYSDETTTLVRLDENDMMCETSTIEWSDELTYRCQEMLRGEAKRSGGHVSLPTIKLLAQLVRDERILLNDDSGSYQWKHAMDDRARCVKPDVKYVASKTCMTCLRVSEGTLDLCPQCHTPFGGSDNA